MSTKQKDVNLINNKKFVKKLKYKPSTEDQVLVELRELSKDLETLEINVDKTNMNSFQDNQNLLSWVKALSGDTMLGFTILGVLTLINSAALLYLVFR